MFQIDFKKLFKEALKEILTEMAEQGQTIAAAGANAAAAVTTAAVDQAAAIVGQTAQVAVEVVNQVAQVAGQVAQVAGKTETVTREVVGKALVDLATNKNREAAVAVLAQFNAKKLDDVPTDSYGKLLEAINLALLV